MSNKLPPILQDDNILEKLEYIFKEHFKNPPYNIPPDISWEEKAINFDKVKERYTKNNNFELKSNDALYISKNNTHYFIEFKIGELLKKNDDKNNNDINIKYGVKKELQLKIYDSIFLLSDIDLNENKYIQDIVNFSKNNIEYILVYYSKNNGDLKINSHLFNKANINLDRFGLSKFKKFLLKEIYIYDEEEFEREFINKVIRDEP
ncbi:geranyl transferase [Brachyspira aalborgi]|uniref:Geranyl transferase n=1 Tax=Brachyspira aalborgi TaxID=29522 RepID=A0A5C8FY62_9SPIR|nr:geranyl transferase [Brachyspira aalborgi]TXJ41487.1 geranyl transferase [Brachyspira aalborgi]TXJ54298.1 geranyl transferase [Brachyspira aalborgi]